MRDALTLITVVLAACGRPPAPAQAPAAQPPVASAPAPRAALDGRLRVSPPAMCGGMVPPPDLQRPPLAPVPDAQLWVGPGESFTGAAPTVALRTDAEGRFMADLPPGRYCVVRSPRGPRPTGEGVLPNAVACVIAQWERCDAIADVPVTAPLAIDIVEDCAWRTCNAYPPPPSAPR